jgi:hypothetical protein
MSAMKMQQQISSILQACNCPAVVNTEGKQAQNFCHYLDKHRDRIINYEYHQAEEIRSIGSGSVESAVKQVDRQP